jgi:hypothetical protein
MDEEDANENTKIKPTDPVSGMALNRARKAKPLTKRDSLIDYKPL